MWPAVVGIASLAAGLATVALYARKAHGAGPQAQRLGRVIAARLNEESKQPDQQFIEQVASLILADANRRGYDPMDYLGIAWIESRFRPYAVSSSGAEGLFQQKPWYASPEPLEPFGPLISDPAVMVETFGNNVDRRRRRWQDWREVWQAYHDGDSGCCDPNWEYANRQAEAKAEFVALAERDQSSQLNVRWGSYPFDEMEEYISDRSDRYGR